MTSFSRNIWRAKVRGLLVLAGIFLVVSAFANEEFYLPFFIIGLIFIALTLLWWKKDL